MIDNNLTGVVPEFTLNKNGVRIKKCCASCTYKEPYEREGSHRKCFHSGKIVDKSDLCGHWIISEIIDDINIKQKDKKKRKCVAQ